MNSRLLSRREFTGTLAMASAAALSGCVSGSAGTAGILDTHTHFYDPTRAQGVPWPPKNDRVLYRPIYPPEFLELARPHGVTGTVVVEASPWIEDNQWVLDLAKDHPCIRGVVGNVKPGRAEFSSGLNRFARHPLFRGIRVGVWEKATLTDAAVLRDLRQLADLGLALDVLTGPDRLTEVARLAEAIPSLRIIIDHCANVRVDGKASPAVWLDGLRACGAIPNVFMKVSGLVEGTGRDDGSAPSDGTFYKPTLDAVWRAFGENRVIFGSNWPVSARFASYATTLKMVQNYFSTKGPAAVSAYFRRNGQVAYRVG